VTCWSVHMLAYSTAERLLCITMLSAVAAGANQTSAVHVQAVTLLLTWWCFVMFVMSASLQGFVEGNTVMPVSLTGMKVDVRDVALAHIRAAESPTAQVRI